MWRRGVSGRRSGDDKEEIKRHHNVDLAKPIRAAIQFDDGVLRSQIDGGKSWGNLNRLYHDMEYEGWDWE